MSVFIFVNFRPIPPMNVIRINTDWYCYTNYALDLRHLEYSSFRYLIFGPGFPLAIALYPGKITPTVSARVSATSFLISLVLVYLLLLPRGRKAATLAAALWTLYGMFLSDIVLYPWSEATFICYALAALVSRRALSKGVWAALATLTRPEGYFLFAGLAAFAKGARSRLLLCAAFITAMSPYLIWLRTQTGYWSLVPPGKANNAAIAPYVAAGVDIREVAQLGTPPPPPTAPRVARILGGARTAEAIRLMTPWARVKKNLSQASPYFAQSLFIVIPGILGLLAMLHRREIPIAFLCLAPTGLTWLIFWWWGNYRFAAPVLLSLCITAGGLFAGSPSKPAAPRLEGR